MLYAQPFEFVDRADAIVFEKQGDAFWTETLDLEKFESARRELLQQGIAPLAGAARDEILQRQGQAFADSGDIGDLAGGVFEDVGDALGIAFDGGRTVAIAAYAEGIFTGDLHEIGGFRKQASNLFVLQQALF